MHSSLLTHALQVLTDFGLRVSSLISFTCPGLSNQMLIGAASALTIKVYRASVFLFQKFSFARLTPAEHQT